MLPPVERAAREVAPLLDNPTRTRQAFACAAAEASAAGRKSSARRRRRSGSSSIASPFAQVMAATGPPGELVTGKGVPRGRSDVAQILFKPGAETLVKSVCRGRRKSNC